MTGSESSPPLPPSGAFFVPTPQAIRRIAAHLRDGGLAALPTETVYGLAAVATNEPAVASVFAIKGRPRSDPLIVHIAEPQQLHMFADAPPEAFTLAAHFWPGPLTLVLPKKPLIPDLVTAGLKTVAVRMPAHREFLAVLREANAPLAAPSANPFGLLSPTRASHVAAAFPHAEFPILDGGPCAIGIESTVIDLTRVHAPTILRPGAISIEAISQCLQRNVSAPSNNATASPISSAQRSPGLLAQHYQPRTPLYLHRQIPVNLSVNSARLFLRKVDAVTSNYATENTFYWTANGESRELAQQLYAILHQIDSSSFQSIHAEWPTGIHPLIQASQNRLLRAGTLIKD